MLGDTTGAETDGAPAAGLRVGLGRALVTPPSAGAMSGFAARTGISEGVADQLEARAVAISAGGGSSSEGGAVAGAAVLVTVDAIGVDSAFTRAVRAQLADQIEPGRVAVVATHTHGGPAILAEAELGAVDLAVRQRYVNGAVAAARAAMAASSVAQLRWGSASVPGLARNRRDPSGPVDDELSVVWAVDRDGEVVGILTTFALHPVVLGPDNLLLTRDYVGYVVDALEREFPAAQAMFMTGCAGQMNHGHAASASFEVKPTASRTFAAAESIGQRLAQAAALVVRSGGEAVIADDVKVDSCRVKLPLLTGRGSGVADDRVVAELTTLLDGARRSGNASSVALLEPQLRWAKRNLGLTTEAYETELMAVGLGKVKLVLLPGEPFVEYGIDLKKAQGSLGRQGTIVVPVAYANDAPGYLPTAEAVSEGGYEVDSAYRFYGLPSRYSASVQAEVARAARALLGRVM